MSSYNINNNAKYSDVKNALHNKDLINEQIIIRGWLRSKRDSKLGFSFLVVNDGSCFDSIQIIVDNNLDNYESEILNLTKDCSLEIYGKLVESKGKGQSVEVISNHIKVFGFVEDPKNYPISPKRHTVEYLREYNHLRVRTNLISAVSRIRHSSANAIHNFFNNNGFFWVNTPIITTNDCEGAGELFKVSNLDYLNLPKNKDNSINFEKDFFGKEVFLTVSGQLNVESYCCALSKVYTFGPTFRAENSNTSRHLAEFWMVEPEIAFSNLDDIAKLAENLLKFVINQVLEERSDDINFLNKFVDKTLVKRLENVKEKKFIEIDYIEAINILQKVKNKFEFKVEFGLDLQSEHEKFLCEKYFKSPVIIKNYPKEIKSFYMRVNDDNKTVAAMDVLVPGVGELIGGSQREERLNVLDERMKNLNIDINSLWWYRDLRKYGTVPHSGFGLGFERLLGYLTGISNVRDLIPFPRTPKNAKF